jgi:hypothetical protein
MPSDLPGSAAVREAAAMVGEFVGSYMGVMGLSERVRLR